MTTTFVLGGARSGKSTFAATLAAQSGARVAYVATCSFHDDEMDQRILKHQQDRPATWKTVEEFQDLTCPIKGLSGQVDVILIDCLTLFLSGLLLATVDETEITRRMQRFLDVLPTSDMDVIIVANEVGLGIVPENALARQFRDLAGFINQRVAQAADAVYFMVAGVPMKIK